MVQKVLAYIIRLRDHKPELLVFDHDDFPEAGTQVPAGTVNEHEDIETALFREIHEESGLHGLTLIRKMGMVEFFHEVQRKWHQKHIFLLKGENIPERWTHIVHADGEDDGMRFTFYWIAVEDARLIYDQGDFLKHVMEEDWVGE